MRPNSNSNDERENRLPQDPLQPIDVPVFGCHVYVVSQPEGGVHARVANLPGLERTASNEREALSGIVTDFKNRIRELMQSGAPIPWIDPPHPPVKGEQKRFIPVHL